VDVGETLDKKQSHEYYMASQKYAQQAIRHKEECSNGHLFLSIALGRVALKAGAKERMRLAKSIRVEAEKAIEYNINNDLAYHVLGRWHRRLADLSWIEKGFANIFLGGVPKDATVENAHKNFQKAIELNPQKISHHLEMGITYIAMDKKHLAVEEFKKVLELPKSDSDDPKHKESAKKFLNDLE
jgi:tetratricopeptide (TPR) repeat protein